MTWSIKAIYILYIVYNIIIHSQDFLQDFTFWGGVEGLWGGGSSLGPLGVKNKVSKNK